MKIKTIKIMITNLLMILFFLQLSLSCTNKNSIETFVNKWNISINNKEIAVLNSFYNDTVYYFGTKLIKADVIKNKNTFYKKHEIFSNKIKEFKQKETLNNGNIKINFIKEAIYDNKVFNVLSQLELKNISNRYVIVLENDIKIISKSEINSEVTKNRKNDINRFKNIEISENESNKEILKKLLYGHKIIKDENITEDLSISSDYELAWECNKECDKLFLFEYEIKKGDLGPFKDVNGDKWEPSKIFFSKITSKTKFIFQNNDYLCFSISTVSGNKGIFLGIFPKYSSAVFGVAYFKKHGNKYVLINKNLEIMSDGQYDESRPIKECFMLNENNLLFTKEGYNFDPLDPDGNEFYSGVGLSIYNFSKDKVTNIGYLGIVRGGSYYSGKEYSWSYKLKQRKCNTKQCFLKIKIKGNFIRFDWIEEKNNIPKELEKFSNITVETNFEITREYKITNTELIELSSEIIKK